MVRPCLMDLKLAAKPYNPKKIERQQRKIDGSTCGTHGFRMCGYSSFDSLNNRIFVDKYVGRTLKADGLSDMFCTFFQHKK